ncbi:1,5-anhydro-D-fructose reductase-like [Schistocerca cancellata]|uniref:1,5-anhydro-D-fructose reductase-like n=1 Tax=Schistocerca cancellata TaxID=274614 RepID=UPI0021187650|nr:1,5-anhydro-D-fructose reductase-like [Schistocerca cancellata]
MAGKLQHITFHNGQKMPIVGLGTWQSSEGEVGKALDVALEAGYRHIDTAFLYRNEREIGATLKKWFNSGKLKREDVFVVTKLPFMGMRQSGVEKYLKKSLCALQLDYVDLYLIHNPVGFQDVDGGGFPKDKDGNVLLDVTTDHVAIWKGMEAQVDAGRARSIGLSNFNARQIKRVWESARIKPANLQVEMHVYFQQRELRAFCRALDITFCAFGPLGSPHIYPFVESQGGDVSKLPRYNQLSDPLVKQIAQKHGKTTAQVLIRFLMQLEVAVIPKSSNPARIKENFAVFDFELSPEEMEALEALDKGPKGRQANEHVLPGLGRHPEFPWFERY